MLAKRAPIRAYAPPLAPTKKVLPSITEWHRQPIEINQIIMTMINCSKTPRIITINSSKTPQIITINCKKNFKS